MFIGLVDLISALLCVSLGALAGWYLNRLGRQAPARTNTRAAAQQALGELHQVAECVRACIQQHTECIQAIEAELSETSAHEPAVLSAAASSIRDANEQVCNEFSQIRDDLDTQAATIDYTLDHSRTLLLTTLSLDQQKHQYEKVLESLQLLAVEVARDVDGCGRKLKRISAAIDVPEHQVSEITGAITQILDATDTVCQRVARAEQTIERHATQIRMQAVLGHTDMLTALPNRRALEAELERMAYESMQNRHPFAYLTIDLDAFRQINATYGHHGGDVVLRGVADLLKNSLRGGDTIARSGGQEFVILFAGTTLAQALPLAERLRQVIQDAQYSYGNRSLNVTGSIGVSQYVRGENTQETQQRSKAALEAAKHNGGNATYWHDGREIHPVHEVHLKKPSASPAPPLNFPSAIAAPVAPPEQRVTSDAVRSEEDRCVVMSQREPSHSGVSLSGRSLFFNNLKRHLDHWYAGGPPVSIILMRVDQHAQLVSRFGAQASDFLKRVIGRLMEASSRNLDERCLYDEQTFALLLVGSDGVSARRIGKRLRSQVSQCKLRFNDEIWELSAALSVVQCRDGATAMDLLLEAEEAINQAEAAGGNMLCMSESA